MYTSETLAYFNLPVFIEKLKTLRSEKDNSNVNYTIILLSTTIIESVLFDIINLTLKYSYPKDPMQQRIFDKQIEKANKASWSELNDLIEIVFGKKLNECVSNNLWKSIKFLFIYRNILVHGKPIVVERNHKENKLEEDYVGKFKLIHEFLIENRVVLKTEHGILNDKVADYFWTQTKSFITNVSECLSDNKNKVVYLMLKDALVNITS